VSRRSLWPAPPMMFAAELPGRPLLTVVPLAIEACVTYCTPPKPTVVALANELVNSA
jgi:hypothetical protein